MANASIIVLGSVNTDLVIRGPKLPTPGETVLGGQFYQAAGGKGANQAVAAARAAGKGEVLFIARVGDDAFGRSAIDQFGREGMICEYVKTSAGQATGVALIMVDQNGENSISVASGANLCLLPEDVDQVDKKHFTAAKVLLTSLESPLETVERALQQAKQAGLITILNPAPASEALIGHPLLDCVDYITPNETEASLLSRMDVVDAESAARAGRKIQEFGCATVVITLGAEGSVIVAEEALPVAAHQAEAVDSTAAGDAFNGALAVALSQGRDLQQAVTWASVAAAISVTRRGAQPSLPGREEIDLLVSRS